MNRRVYLSVSSVNRDWRAAASSVRDGRRVSTLGITGSETVSVYALSAEIPAVIAADSSMLAEIIVRPSAVSALWNRLRADALCVPV